LVVVDYLGSRALIGDERHRGHSYFPVSRRSFDHLVGAREHRHRYIEAKSLRGLEVDHHLVSSRRLNWKVRRLLAFEDTIDIAGRLAEQVDKIRT
jgi:hypothetical protein